MCLKQYIQILVEFNKYKEGGMTVVQSIPCSTFALSNKFVIDISRSHTTAKHR